MYEFFWKEDSLHYDVQVDLELLGSSNPPTSACCAVGTSEVLMGLWLTPLYLVHSFIFEGKDTDFLMTTFR
jgi:hypothetical protein